MTNDDQDAKGRCGPALLRLLSLVRQAFPGCSVWLLLERGESKEGNRVLLDEDGSLGTFSVSSQVGCGARLGALAARELFPEFGALAEKRGMVLVGAVALPHPEVGSLLLISEDVREEASLDWRVLEDFAAQVSIVLERDRLAASMKKSRASGMDFAGEGGSSRWEGGNECNEMSDAFPQRADHLGALTLQLARSEQEERRRLAQVLHDHLQQLLVAARIGMGRVRLQFPKGTSEGSLRNLEHLLDESIQASRSLTMELSPPVLHEGSLTAALEWLGARMCEKDGLEVRITTDPGADRHPEALRVFLFQAVRELLVNCRKYAGVDRVSVVVERLKGERLRIVVEDEGAGFDPEFLDLAGAHLRDRFGLFSLRERIGHIGGGMTVETAPGRGTRVTLVTPLQPAFCRATPNESPLRGRMEIDSMEKTGSAKVESGNLDRPVRLVLVDDHRIMRQGLKELFREEPDFVVVGEAENGLEGLQVARDVRPDLVVMDISMPVMNGVEATRRLHAELPEVKVIGLSMHVKEDMATAIMSAGASAYVTKPTAAHTLIGTIRQVMGIVKGGSGSTRVAVGTGGFEI